MERNLQHGSAMNALELLKQQHDQVKELFAQFESTDDPEEKDDLVQELSDNLAAHAAIEEKIFYPAAYGGSTKELLSEAVEEHLAAKRIIADLLDLSSEDESFDAKVKVLKEQIEHHVKEEEQQLFPKVRQKLNADKLEALGEQMEDLFEQELEDDPSEKVPEQTLEAAPLPTEAHQNQRS
ncbi:MAG TPA: hemerythrin domain-containing protein [Polyangiaceae bacterium]